MNNGIMDHLNGILWALFGVLTVVQIFLRFALPAFRKDPSKAGVVETLDSLWVAMAVALCLKAVLVQPFTIPSGSMEDTLEVGDYILVKKYSYGYSLLNQTPRFLEFNKPKRGDVLVFVYPKDPNFDFIKRCIGLPGDVIELKNAEVYVNGQKQVEPYVKHIMTPLMALSEEGPDTPKVNFGPVTVEPGHYFMMGDNRDNSADSRYWGQLDEKNIKGKAWLIYWHSVGLPVFLAMVACVVAFFCLIGWGMAYFRKPPPGDAAAGEIRTKSMQNNLYTALVCLGLAVLLFVRVGPDEFKDRCQKLQARMFTLIR